MSSMFGGTKKIEILTPGQKALLGDLTNKVRGEIGQSAEVYGGQITPDANANMQAAFDGAGGLLQRQDDSSAIASLLSGRGDIEGVNQFYRDSVVAPAQQQFGNALRQIDNRYGNTWGATGGHQRMVGDATAQFGTGIGSVLGNLVLQDRNAAADRQAVGVQAQAQSGQDQMGRLVGTYGLGAEERGVQGQFNAEDFNKWQMGQDYNNPWLGYAQTALSTPAFAIGQEKGKFQQIAGAVGAGLGAIGGGMK